MSTIKVNNLSGKGGATPNLPDGAVISGVATVTNLKPTNVNVSGAVTATTFDGSLKSTGTPTLGLGVTINSSGIHVSGVATVGVLTGGTYYGDGSNLTGVGDSIAPWYYNPDVNDLGVVMNTGIGITFNTKVVAGSGEVTLKIVSAGVAGTTIQSWGVSSCTFDVQKLILGSLVTNLEANAVYQLDVPSTFIDDSGGQSYAGTAYTFGTMEATGYLYGWGNNELGEIGDNTIIDRSSPVQIPGVTWTAVSGDTSYSSPLSGGIKADNTLWMWGDNELGELGQNNAVQYSSPVQIPGSWKVFGIALNSAAGVKDDGTLWVWGDNSAGQLGQNSLNDHRSSPVQVPGTTWSTTVGKFAGGYQFFSAVKTDGTLWNWGHNSAGNLGMNNTAQYSSPCQVPGTDWSFTSIDVNKSLAIRTDNTLWVWGKNQHGQLGLANDKAYKSSPIQVPGSWATAAFGDDFGAAVNTDGELFTYGDNGSGQLGLNHRNDRSSPIQVGSDTTWGKTAGSLDLGPTTLYAVKTDGTLWGFGNGGSGRLQTASEGYRSSPVQLSSGVSNISQVVVGKANHIWADY